MTYPSGDQFGYSNKIKIFIHFEPEIPLLFCCMFIPQVLVYKAKEAFIVILFKIPKYQKHHKCLSPIHYLKLCKFFSQHTYPINLASVGDSIFNN